MVKLTKHNSMHMYFSSKCLLFIGLPYSISCIIQRGMNIEMNQQGAINIITIEYAIIHQTNDSIINMASIFSMVFSNVL